MAMCGAHIQYRFDVHMASVNIIRPQWEPLHHYTAAPSPYALLKL